MDKSLGIFLLCFAGAILLYAGLLALTGDAGMLPYRVRHTMKRKDKAYMRLLALITAIVGTVPLIAGLVIVCIAP